MNTASTKKSLADCYYAAGIAIGRWYFGFPADTITVGMPTESRPETLGEPQRSKNHVLIKAPPIAPREHLDESGLQGAEREWQRRCGIILAETELVVLACGFRAPVRQRDQCCIGSWRKRRPDDYARAMTLSERLVGEPTVNLELACVRARALLSAYCFVGSLRYLAGDFAEHGCVNTEQIHGRCDEYGSLAPARATWSQSWPPSLEQLQEAYVPYLDLFEEDLIDRAYDTYQALVNEMG